METVKHESYVSSKVVTLLTKAGFDWKDYFVAHDINEHFHWEIPLHIAQRWLREVKHWEINIMWFPAEPQYIGVSKEHYMWTLQMQIKIGLKNEPNTFIYDTIMKKMVIKSFDEELLGTTNNPK